ncbi:uncharacterized protein LOC136024806 isoform X2 [Artemia franciscana]|uniref:uncharacterized protein LOC136024806 isoform X2 n=1 Tax=Artemia franciscana TaxID=6661 RepID=UPI0032DBBD04
MVTLSCNKNEMVKTLKLIGNEEEYTDVNIIAEGSSVPCHRAILSAVSPFFKKLFNDIPPWEKDLSISLAETSFEDLKLALTLLYKGEIFISMSHSLKVMELVNFLDLPCFKKSKIEVLPYLPPDSDSVDLELPNLSESNSAEKEKNKKIFNPKIVLQKTNNEFIQETGAAIWRCEICGKAHNSWLLLSLHKDTQCGTKVPSICVECQSKIKSYPEFVLHNVEHKVSEQKMCPICLSINVDNIEQHLVSSGHVAPDMFQAPSPMTSSHLKSTGYPSKRKKPLLRPKSKQVLYSELFTSSSDEEKMSEPEGSSPRRKYRRNSVSTGHSSTDVLKVHRVGTPSIKTEGVESATSAPISGLSGHKVHVPKPSCKDAEIQDLSQGLKDKCKSTSQVSFYKPKPKSKQIPVQATEYKPQPKSKQIRFQASHNNAESTSDQVKEMPVDSQPMSQVFDHGAKPKTIESATVTSKYKPKPKSKQIMIQASSYQPKPKSKQTTTQASDYKPKPKSKQSMIQTPVDLPKTESTKKEIETSIDLLKPKLENPEIQPPNESPRPGSEKSEREESLCTKNCVYCGLPAKPYYVHMSRCSKRYFVPVVKGQGTDNGDFRCNVCDKITDNRHLHYKDHHSVDRLTSLGTPLPTPSVDCPVCNIQFPSQPDLDVHMRLCLTRFIEKSNETFFCTECQQLVRKIDLALHLSSCTQLSAKKNENDKEMSCDLGKKDVDTEKAMTGTDNKEDIFPVLEDLSKTTYKPSLTSAKRGLKVIRGRGRKFGRGRGSFSRRSLNIEGETEFSSDLNDKGMIRDVGKEDVDNEKAFTGAHDNKEDIFPVLEGLGKTTYKSSLTSAQRGLKVVRPRGRKFRRGRGRFSRRPLSSEAETEFSSDISASSPKVVTLKTDLSSKENKEDEEMADELEKEVADLEKALITISTSEEDHKNSLSKDSHVGVQEVQVAKKLYGPKRRRHKENKEDKKMVPELEKEYGEIEGELEKEDVDLERALTSSGNKEEDHENSHPKDSSDGVQEVQIAKKLYGPKRRRRKETRGDEEMVLELEKEDEEIEGELEKEDVDLEIALTSSGNKEEDHKNSHPKDSSVGVQEVQIAKKLYGPKRRRRQENKEEEEVSELEIEDEEIVGELEKEVVDLEKALTGSYNKEEDNAIPNPYDPSAKIQKQRIGKKVYGPKRRPRGGRYSRKLSEIAMESAISSHDSTSLTASPGFTSDTSAISLHDDSILSHSESTNAPKTCDEGGHVEITQPAELFSRPLLIQSESSNCEEIVSKLKETMEEDTVKKQQLNTERKLVGDEINMGLNKLTNKTLKETAIRERSPVKSNKSLMVHDPLRQMLATTLDMLLSKPIENNGKPYLDGTTWDLTVRFGVSSEGKVNPRVPAVSERSTDKAVAADCLKDSTAAMDLSTSADIPKKRVTIFDLPKPSPSSAESILSKGASQKKLCSRPLSNPEFEIIDLERDEPASSSSSLGFQRDDDDILIDSEINVKGNSSEAGRSSYDVIKCHKFKSVAESGGFNSPKIDNDRNQQIVVLDPPTNLFNTTDAVESLNSVKTQVPIRTKAFAQLPKTDFESSSDILQQILEDSIVKSNPPNQLVERIVNDSLEPVSTVTKAQLSSTLSYSPLRPPPSYNKSIQNPFQSPSSIFQSFKTVGTPLHTSSPLVKQRVTPSVKHGRTVVSVSDIISKNTGHFVKLPTLGRQITPPQTFNSNELGVSMEEPMDVMPSTFLLQPEILPHPIRGAVRIISESAACNQVDTEADPEV